MTLLEQNIRSTAHFIAAHHHAISATELAEEVAYSLCHPEWLDQENHLVWDIAAKIVEPQ